MMAGGSSLNLAPVPQGSVQHFQRLSPSSAYDTYGVTTADDRTYTSTYPSFFDGDLYSQHAGHKASGLHHPSTQQHGDYRHEKVFTELKPFQKQTPNFHQKQTQNFHQQTFQNYNVSVEDYQARVNPFTGHHSPAVGHQSPVMSHHSPAIGHQSPVLSHQSPTISHQSPVVGHHSPVMSHHSPGKVSPPFYHPEHMSTLHYDPHYYHQWPPSVAMPHPESGQPHPDCPPPPLKVRRLGAGNPVPTWTAKGKNNCVVSLYNGDMWAKFHIHSNEMIITKHGRRMFPVLHYVMSGLDPHKKYHVYVDMSLADNNHWKFQGGKWVSCGTAEPLPQGKRFFFLPVSPNTGAHWMKQDVSFGKLKLTNNKGTKQKQIILNSMHRYQPRINIAEDVDGQEGDVIISHAFVDTQFIAVTAYQNTD
ncbi:T-box brain protein 1-like, partial [Physella acuta]|uniref:T-box brain protein 1-like n=1 Tax=Physella acuta TaxID=109671 RepID=UPI0027DB302E